MKKVIITGVSSGLGFCFVKKILSEGNGFRLQEGIENKY